MINVENLKEEFKPGDEIVLYEMRGEPQMGYGLKGKVLAVDDIGQVHVAWENGSSLALNVEEDAFEKVEKNIITVIMVEPNQEARITEIDSSLESMQNIVGGYIEEYMPFEDEVAIICNEEGKVNRLPLNRAVYDEHSKEMIEIIAGDFFIAYAPVGSENFKSLPKDLEKKYAEKFKYPERFYKQNGQIKAYPVKPKNRDMER